MILTLLLIDAFVRQCICFVAVDLVGSNPSDIDSTSNTFTLYSDESSHIDMFRGIADSFANYGDDVNTVVFTVFSRFDVKLMQKDEQFCLTPSKSCLIHHPPVKADRTCLVSTPQPPERIKHIFNGNYDCFDEVFAFILDNAGFSLNNHSQFTQRIEHYKVTPESVCDSLDYSNFDPNLFLSKYWLRQRPVILRNFFHASSRVDIEHHLTQQANTNVGAKLSPTKDFEGTVIISIYAV